MMHVALNDLQHSFLRWRLWTLLGWLEIRQRYARSRIGPFWLTISMGVVVCSIGLVYGSLFGQTLNEYLPYLAISLVLWNLLTSIVQEGSNAYIHNSAYIRQVDTPKLIYILQVTWRNLLVFFHNSVIILILFMIYGVKKWSVLPLFFPGLLVLAINATWMAALSGLLSARFRDFPQIVASMMQIAFYLTPIMFKPESLTKYSYIVDLNPFGYLMNLVRQPLLGERPALHTWMITLFMAIVGWSLAIGLTNRYLKRIPYWV